MIVQIDFFVENYSLSLVVVDKKCLGRFHNFPVFTVDSADGASYDE